MRQDVVIISVSLVASGALFWSAALLLMNAVGKYRDEAEATRKANLLLYESNLRIAAEIRSYHTDQRLAAEWRRDFDQAARAATFTADPNRESA